MAKLHLRFRNIRPDVLDAARSLFDVNPHTLDPVMQEAAANTFLTRVCEAYNVPTPEVRIEEYRGRYHGSYEYLPAEAIEGDDGPESIRAAQVILRKFSVLNLFGIARTHLLNHQAVAPKADEPWGWACSLFYAVKPVRFRKLVREGKIKKGLRPSDTYSRATFARMVAAGVAEEDGNVLVANFDPRTLDAIESGEIDIRTILPRSAQPSALSSWDWDDDDAEVDILAEDSVAPTDEQGPFDEDTEQEDDGEDADQTDLLHDPDAFTEEAERMEATFGNSEGDHPELEEQNRVNAPSLDNDGLDDLGIVELRKLIKGRVPGGYSLSKPDLIAALRAQRIGADGQVRA